MAITILQEPLNFTPSNAQHIYNAISTLSGQTDFRYIFDVWVSPFDNSRKERIARLKVSPNTAGNGIVDVGDIILNYLKANPRSEGTQIFGWTGTSSNNTTTPNGIITNNPQFSLREFNSFNSNSAYEYLPHIIDYKVLIGEQFLSGNTSITSICNDPSYSASTMTYSFSNAMTSYPGDPNTVDISGAGDGGLTWEHNSFGGSVVSSGSTTASTYSYTAVDAPTTGDILTITEVYSGYQIRFIWNAGETSGWDFLSIYEPPCVNQPNAILTWPGVQQNKTNFNFNNIYWSVITNPNGSENHKWWDYYRYTFTGTTTNITDTNPHQWLSTFGDEELVLPNLTGTTSGVGRTRSHHYQCPIILNLFGRDTISYSSINIREELYTNNQYVTGFTNSFNITGFSNSVDSRILSYHTYSNGEEKKRVRAYGPLVGSGTAISEIVEYEFFGDECMSDPIHFLFLNQNGVWDTWTFDRKNIRTVEKETDFYSQGMMRNNSTYNPFFYDRRDIPYNQNVTEIVEAQSHFMKENDRKIVEELFLSTSVYLMKEHYYYQDPTTPYLKTPFLIPVVIISNSFQEYKQRYNKVFQYTLTFRYNPLQQHRSNL
jgi:hypothetical protein